MADFVLDNGALRVGFTTAGGSFTSLFSQGREYLWQGDPAVWSGQAPVCFPICGGLRGDSAGFTTAGGSFTSLFSQGREYLWQGDPAVWSGQAPVCFPICGGLRGDSAKTRSGKQVKLGRHGFARKQEWELAGQGEGQIAFRLSSAEHPELLEQFPFPFTLTARYAIDGARLDVSYEVTNEGDEDMPFLGRARARSRSGSRVPSTPSCSSSSRSPSPSPPATRSTAPAAT